MACSSPCCWGFTGKTWRRGAAIRRLTRSLGSGGWCYLLAGAGAGDVTGAASRTPTPSQVTSSKGKYPESVRKPAGSSIAFCFFFKLECDYFMMLCFCFTTKWISCMYTYVPSLELPSFPTLDVVTLAVTQCVLSHIHAEGWIKLYTVSPRGETLVSPTGSIFGGK